MPRQRKSVSTPRPVALLWPYNLTPAEFAAKYPPGLIKPAPLANALSNSAQKKEQDREEARSQA